MSNRESTEDMDKDLLPKVNHIVNPSTATSDVDPTSFKASPVGDHK